MSTDQLSRDPAKAAEILATLQEKDQNETICRYPTCNTVRQVTTGTGRPSAYCDNPEHTPVSNHRARASLRAIAAGVILESTPKREVLPLPPAGVASMESLRSSVVSGMMQLQSNLERYVTTLAEMADPDLAAAQIQTTLDRAETRIAEALQSASAERSLRLAAEAASITARQEAEAERDAAEIAISKMEEAEARTKRIEAEAEQHIMEIQAERDRTIDRLRVETQLKIEEIQIQAKEAVAQAQTAAALAQEEAKLADARAHDAETEARSRVATAEQLVSEARAMVQREQAQGDQLRTDLADARSHAEADRVESRAALERERTEARTILDRERTEVDRLRGDLTAARLQIERVTTRADQLAALTDELRTQLVQKSQMTEREMGSEQ